MKSAKRAKAARSKVAALKPMHLLPAAVLHDGHGDPDGKLIPPTAARNMEFGRRLTAALAVRKLMQSDLARMTGVGRDSISGYCRGRAIPEHERLSKICEALDLKPDDLVPVYGIDARRADAMPAFAIKQAEQDGKVWLTINRTVTLEQAIKITALIGESLTNPVTS